MGYAILILDHHQERRGYATKMLELGKIDKIIKSDVNYGINPREFWYYVEGKQFADNDGRIAYVETYQTDGEQLMQITPRLKVSDYESAKELISKLSSTKKLLEIEINNELEPKKRRLICQLVDMQSESERLNDYQKKIATDIELMEQNEKLSNIQEIKKYINILNQLLGDITLSGDGYKVNHIFTTLELLENKFKANND